MQSPQNHVQENLGIWNDKLLTYAFIFEMARETGFVKRFRKLDPAYLVYILTFGISSHIRPTFEEIHRRYIDFDDNPKFSYAISIQSFKKRFDQNMANFLFKLLDHYIDVMVSGSPARLKSYAARFKDILIQDSCIIRLCQILAGQFPAARSRNNGAGLKIHAVYSARAHSVKTIEITGERIHDSRMLRIGPAVKDILLINDLGYYSPKTFARIKEYGGYFVSRLKTNAKTKVITVVSGKVSGNMEKSIDSKNYLELWDFLDKVPKKGIYDLECSFEIQKAQNRKNIPQIEENFRVICFWNEITLVWHTYLTNLSAEHFTPDEVYELYKYRWVIELLFKELKSDYDLGELLIKNPSLAYIHIYSMIIRMIVSRNLYSWILLTVEPEKREKYGPLLWSKVFAEKSHEFLSILNQWIFGTGEVCERWDKLERSLRQLAKSRHKKPRLSQAYTTL